MQDDRLLIHELIGLHGPLCDEAGFDRLSEVFTDDVVYDVSALGGGQLIGLAAIADAGNAPGDANPVGHHVTNIVVTDLEGDCPAAVSKGLAVLAGSVGSALYEDTLIRTPGGWRIARRRVLPRRKPLHPSTE